jgi:hypothetical protein
MSQIDLSYDKESGTKKRKTEVSTYDFQTPPNISPQRSKFLFETSIHSSNSKNQSGLAGLEALDYLHQGIPEVPGERRKINPMTSHLVDNMMPVNRLEHHLHLVYSSQVTAMDHSVTQNKKGTPAAKM